MNTVDNAFKVISNVPVLDKWVNRLATNYLCTSTAPRPRAFSLWSHEPKPVNPDQWGPVGEYTCWPMLVDQHFSGRHLSPAATSYIDSLPEDMPYNPQTKQAGQITELFRRQGEMKTDRSSLLFMFFAQWFTDSVLRIDPDDRRKNTSNHNIDLCQIYGLTEKTTCLLREKEGGRLRSQIIDGEEYPDYLGEVDADGVWHVKQHYQELPYASKEKLDAIFGGFDVKRRHKLYATGLERGNSSVGYVAISILFLREHNRICGELRRRFPNWDDERLFQTARMINIVILMKLVIEDYINHIAGVRLFRFDPAFAEKTNWYRTPWIALEFDLLYRWHGMVPDFIEVQGKNYGSNEFRTNNALLEEAGLNTLISECSTQPAGKIGLGNVPEFMLPAEYAMVRMGREFRLQPYNAYRRLFHHRLFGIKPLRTFSDLTDDPALQARLRTLYKNVGQVEFVVGLFAQKPTGDALFGDLLKTMVAYDAFTQIYTNPLLSKNVFNERTFTRYGLDLIEQTKSVQDLVNRNGIVAKAGFGL